MSRPLRIEYPGAFYHVTARGNAREPIFLDDDDRTLFLTVLARTVEHMDWRCHAYCLMDNHYHLLIETPQGNLARGMRQLNGVYTQRFNRRHGRVGHVFQGRYKAILVERDNYLMELCRYVVLNPVRAGMVEDIARYRWSSYRATTGLEPVPEWLFVDGLLDRFGSNRRSAGRKFAEFVAEGKPQPSPWLKLKGQVLLGSESFIAQLHLQMAHPDLEIPRSQRMLQRPDLASIFSKEVRADKPMRDEAIRRAYLEYGYTMASIANFLGIHYSTVSRVIKGVRPPNRDVKT